MKHILTDKTTWVIAVLLATAFFIGRWTSSTESLAPHPNHTAFETAPQTWTCSMHPQIQLPDPGQCPICFMDLIPMESSPNSAEASELRLSPAAAELAEVETSILARGKASTNLDLQGKVELDESLVRRVSAWVPGRLERLYVDYTGIRVQQGEHLFDVYSPELFTAQEELLQAAAWVRDASDGNRLSARKTLDSVREKFRLLGFSDENILKLEQQQVASATLTIHSPVSGVVIHKNAEEGLYVQTGTPVYTIADLSRVWIVLNAYESQLASLAFGQQVAIQAEALPGQEFSGAISFIDPLLDEKTRTVRVRISVNNDNGLLKPGMLVRATVEAQLDATGSAVNPALAGKWVSPMHPEIVKDGPGSCDICGMPLVPAEELGIVRLADSPEDPLLIPMTAVLRTGKRAVVYVKREADDELVFEGREVELGRRVGDYYIVLSGLTEGDEVVTRGNFKIDSAMQIAAKPSMMSPEGRTSGPVNQYGDSRSDLHATERKLPKVVVPDELAEGILDAYLELQERLAADQFDASYTALMTLHNLTMGVAGLEAIMEPSMRSITDIHQLRAAFQDISIAMRGAAENGQFQQSVREAYCPMAFDFTGAYWLQIGDQISNPYFGAQMLSCGEIQRTFTGDSDHDQ